MKKKIIIGVLAVFAEAVVIVIFFLLNRDVIGTERAQAIVLEHSGISAGDAEFTKVELDGSEYDIEFIAPDGKYEYEISSYTGDILEYKRDINRGGADFGAEASPTEPPIKNNMTEALTEGNSQEVSGGNNISDLPERKTAQPEKLSEQEIFDIAYNHAGVKYENVLYSEIKFKEGVYDLEFDTADYEYDYKISPSGQVIEFEKEIQDGYRLKKHHTDHY